MLTGWRVGEAHWGGYASRARVDADWLIPVPDDLTTRQAMTVGTAGFTAMQALMALERHGLRPGDGRKLLVTGGLGRRGRGLRSSGGRWPATTSWHRPADPRTAVT